MEAELVKFLSLRQIVCHNQLTRKKCVFWLVIPAVSAMVTWPCCFESVMASDVKTGVHGWEDLFIPWKPGSQRRERSPVSPNLLQRHTPGILISYHQASSPKFPPSTQWHQWLQAKCLIHRSLGDVHIPN